ncbi:unnamed protein product [Phytomonas sp. Hart1]|nr:unnamed protein product [Phytomonas sp. Hart1]|eukprot:CCW72024.1 unnamed protein product [Phytomonas sp. isolate Hart1]
MYKMTLTRLAAAAGSGPFDPYRILGVDPSASKDEIKRAYHRLALRYHPDGGPDGNAERFAAVHEAYKAVEGGKWRPAAEPTAQTSQPGAYGWDAKMRTYVYERPGSTTENYVSGHTQTILRLCMVWCFLFVVVRFSLLWGFPNRAKGNGGRTRKDLHADDDLASRDATQDDDTEFKWAVDMHRKANPHPAESVDPFARNI